MSNIVATGFMTITDLSDPIISSTEPPSPVEDMLWMDTSSTPPILKMYKNGEWVPVSDIGGAVPDSIPAGGYYSGDLIINKNNSGALSNGSIQVIGGNFVHTNGGKFTVPSGKYIKTPFMSNSGAISYIVFIGNDHSRFGTFTDTESKHFINAFYKNKKWYYNRSGTDVEFIQNESDCIVAKIEESKTLNKIDKIIKYYENEDSVFEALTNGGQVQGLYKKDGMLFVHAEHIATGKLTSTNKATEMDLDRGTFRLGGTNDSNYTLKFDGRDLYFSDGAIKWDNLDDASKENLRKVTVEIVGGVRSISVSANGTVQTQPTVYQAKVYLGAEDITSLCTFSWKASGVYTGTGTGVSFTPNKGTHTVNETYINVTARYANSDMEYRIGLSVSKEGNAGTSGSNGISVTSVDVEYAMHTSATSVPTTGWQTTTPTWVDGKYIWSRTKTTYSSGSPTYTNPACITGGKGQSGANGANGADGSNGTDGKGIKSTTITYQASSSGTDIPSGTWTASIPSVAANQYLWTRTVLTYTDNTTSTAYSVGKMGANGATGPQGPAGTSAKYVIVTGEQTFKYTNNFSGTPTPATIKLTASLVGTSGAQWSYRTPGSTTINNISGATSATYDITHNNSIWGSNKQLTFRCTSGGIYDEITIVKVSDGTNGANGTNGSNGADGKGIKSTTITYQASSSGTTAPTGAWSATIPPVTSNQYLWTRTVLTYTDNSTATAYSVGKMGANGTNGATGPQGPSGNGIKSTAITYQASSSGTTAPTGAWSATIPSVAANQYLWTRTVLTYTDNSTATAYSVGKMGANGTNGTNGAAGKDAYTVVLSNESHTFPGSTSAALAGSTKCEIIAYKGSTRVGATIGTISGLPTGMTAPITNNGASNVYFTPTVTTSMTSVGGVLVVPITVDGHSFTKNFTYTLALKGSNGANGSNGTNGADGNGIKSSAITYQASSSGTTVPTGTWSTSIPSVAASQYLWTRTVFTFTNNSTTTAYSVGKMGANGTNGSNGATGATGQGVQSITEEYYLSTSKTSQAGGSWVTTPPAWSIGKYMWTRSKIVYKNPTATEYTTPVCDSSWEAVNDIEIGVRNLIINGTFNQEHYGWIVGSASATTIDAAGVDGKKSSKTIGALNQTRNIYSEIRNLEKDTEYTFTGYYKCENVVKGVTNYHVCIYASYSYGGKWVAEFPLSESILGTKDWTKVTKTFKTRPTNDWDKLDIIGYVRDCTGIVWFDEFKLAKGNKATDWTPAPEDVDGNTVSKVETLYYLSTSSTSQAGGSWSTTFPNQTLGKFIWTRTKTTLVNGKIFETVPALYQPSWLQDWNGTKTEIGGSHVISPKIFAGTKEANGSATGVAIGKDVFGSGVNYSGIMGYKSGVKTFHFKTDGTMLIGKDTVGNHISWNGDTLSIKGDVRGSKFISETENNVGDALDPNNGNTKMEIIGSRLTSSYDSGRNLGHVKINGRSIELYNYNRMGDSSETLTLTPSGVHGHLRVRSGNIEISDGTYNFIAPNNYGYMGRDTNGNADYMLYMRTDNKVSVGHNNRQIVLDCDNPIQRSGHGLFHEGRYPISIDQTHWNMQDMDWVGTQASWGGDRKLRSIQVNGGDSVQGMYSFGACMQFGGNHATGQIYLPDNQNQHEMYFRSTWGGSGGGTWKRLWNNVNMPNPMNMVNGNGYWGLSAMGRDEDWVRTTRNGLIPYQSGGHGNLGTESWRFREGWFNKIDANWHSYFGDGINVTGPSYFNPRATSGRYFQISADYWGNSGSEPSLIPNSTGGWGSVGIDSYPLMKGYAYQWVTKSDRDVKYEISKLDNESMYNYVKDLNTYSYRHISTCEDDEDLKREDLQIGCMVDELPTEVVDYDNEGGVGKSIDLYSYTTMNIGATKELIKKVEVLERENEELKNRLEKLEVALDGIINGR